MPCFFVQPQDIAQGEVTLRGQDAYHIARSLRMAVGDTVTVSDGAGRRLLCRLTVIRDDRVTADIVDTLAGSGELPGDILLCQALPKRDKLELIVQKATELGAAGILPFVSSRCIRQVREGRTDRQTERLCRIAREAAMQCGRGRIPQVGEPVTFDALAGLLGDRDAVYFCYEGAGTQHLRDWLAQGCPERIAVIVGAEGGFSPEEADAARRAGWHMTGLGGRILRCETAGPFVLSCFGYFYGC